MMSESVSTAALGNEDDEGFGHNIKETRLIGQSGRWRMREERDTRAFSFFFLGGGVQSQRMILFFSTGISARKRCLL